MRKITVENFEYVLEPGSKVIGLITETKTKYNISIKPLEDKRCSHKKN